MIDGLSWSSTRALVICHNVLFDHHPPQSPPTDATINTCLVAAWYAVAISIAKWLRLSIALWLLTLTLGRPYPLPSDRQHFSYDVCVEVRGEIIRTVLCCIVYWSCAQSYAHLDEPLLQFSGLGFVTLGPFHCAEIYLCVCVCILCVLVLHCIVAVSLWARWGGPDGIEA